MKNIGKISGIKLFEILASEHVEKLKEIAKRKKIKKNEMLFNEGDESNGFFFILEGKVKVFKVTSDGKEQIFAVLGKGDAPGLAPVFLNQPFHVNALALEDSLLLFFPRKEFKDLLSEDAELSMKLFDVVSNRLKGSADIISILSKQKTETRIAAYILGLAEKQDNDKEVFFHIMKQDIASLLGITPETFSRVFLKMVDKKIIEADGNKVTIPDIEKLKELADSSALK